MSRVGPFGLDRKTLAILLTTMALAVALCLFSRNGVDNVNNDPLGQMIASQGIVDHHSLSLDYLDPDTMAKLTYHIMPAANGRHYYYFPFGTTLMSLPLVYVLRHFGWDMLHDEEQTEHLYCAIAAPIIILMLFSIARRVISLPAAAVLAALMWGGTSLSSVGGLAPWAHLTSTGFATLAILLAMRDPEARSSWLRLGLGLALFMAYLSRPTMCLLTPMMLWFIACRSRRSAIWVGSVVAACLLAFFVVNIHIFGEARPLFYASDRLGTTTYWTGIYGNLLGPSRGLFIFSPFLIVSFFFVGRIARSNQRSWLLLALVWPILHLLVVADFPRWWAGYSFGPRYTMEVLPGLFLLLCLAWAEARKADFGIPTAAALAFLGAFSIFVHDFEGMNNPAASAWNGVAATDEHPELTLDWRWPQWAATEARNDDLLAFRLTLPIQ